MLMNVEISTIIVGILTYMIMINEETLGRVNAQADFKVKKRAKIRNQYNQVPHQARGTIWESDKNTRTITHKRAKRSALSQQAITRLQGQTRQHNRDKDET